MVSGVAASLPAPSRTIPLRYGKKAPAALAKGKREKSKG